VEALNYLLKVLFDALFTVLVLRVWLQLVRADFYNPISQFIVKVTNPLVVPVRKVIPGLGGIDLATVLIAYIVAVIKFIIIIRLNGGPLDIPISLFIGALFFLKQVGVLLFMIMLVMALMSWVVQGYNPTMALFQQLTDPFLKPIRRVIPAIGGLDLSIIVAFLALNVINILLAGVFPSYWMSL
jgi:YggT family protein